MNVTSTAFNLFSHSRIKNWRVRASIVCIFAGCVLPVAAQTVQTPRFSAEQSLEAELERVRAGDFQAAIPALQAIVRRDAENLQARRALAIALIGVDKFPEASRELAQLLARAPKDRTLLETAATVFLRQQRFVEAETVLKRRLTLGEERAELWAQMGDALDPQKKTEAAARAYEQAVRLAPDKIVYRYALGALYWKQVRFEDAEKVFLEILRQQPNEPRASFNLGDIYLTNGDPARALTFLETAAKSFPDEFDTRFALGRALLANGDANRAIEELQHAVRLNDKIAEGFYHLGRALQRANRKDEAKAALQKAQELKDAKRAAETIKERTK